MSNRLIVKQDIDTGEIGFGKINENDLVEGIKDKNYEHIQLNGSTAWSIPHNLGKKPSITAIDSNGNRVFGVEKHIDNNNSILEFNVSISGVATCN